MKIWKKSLVITKDFIGLDCLIYDGHKFIKLKVLDDMLNLRFGEFVKTKIVKHNFDKKNEKKRKK